MRDVDRSIGGKIGCEMIGVKAGRWVGIRVHYTILSIFECFYYENVLKVQYLLQNSVPLPMHPITLRTRLSLPCTHHVTFSVFLQDLELHEDKGSVYLVHLINFYRMST